MMSETKGKHGGPRPNSGRKRSEAAKLRSEHLNKQHTLAIEALDYCAAVMRGKNERGEAAEYEPKDRLAAAKIVMDRVWGKPKMTLLHGIPDSGESGVGSFSVTFKRKDA